MADLKTPPQPPRHQARGPISKGPRSYLACPMCTMMLKEDARPGKVVGIPKAHAKQHLRDHQLGRIKRPTEKEKT